MKPKTQITICTAILALIGLWAFFYGNDPLTRAVLPMVSLIAVVTALTSGYWRDPD